MCNNLPGKYECSCGVGYIKKGNSCLGINVPENESKSIIYLTESNIGLLSDTIKSTAVKDSIYV